METIEWVCDGDYQRGDVWILNGDKHDFYDHCFAFWQEDCFDPPVTLVFGRCFQDAYEEYCDEVVAKHPIDEEWLDDYLDDAGELTCSFSSNGTPIDTESVNGRKIY